MGDCERGEVVATAAATVVASRRPPRPGRPSRADDCDGRVAGDVAAGAADYGPLLVWVRAAIRLLFRRCATLTSCGRRAAGRLPVGAELPARAPSRGCCAAAPRPGFRRRHRHNGRRAVDAPRAQRVPEGEPCLNTQQITRKDLMAHAWRARRATPPRTPRNAAQPWRNRAAQFRLQVRLLPADTCPATPRRCTRRWRAIAARGSSNPSLRRAAAAFRS